jgi:hypothetical protein
VRLSAQAIPVGVVLPKRLGFRPVTCTNTGPRRADEGRFEGNDVAASLEAELFVQLDDVSVAALDPVDDIFRRFVVPVIVSAEHQARPEGFFEVVIEGLFGFRIETIVDGQVQNAGLTSRAFVIMDERHIEELATEDAGRGAVSIQETNHGILLLLQRLWGTDTFTIIS